MPIPPEISWLVPLVLPFIVGLLAGLLVKRTISLVVLGIALIAVLSTAGYISLGVRDVYKEAMNYLPRLISTGNDLKDVLPYSSPAFLVGLALGLWKG